MNVGSRITYFRELKKYSVNKLANLAGISQSYLRDIEMGNKKNPSIDFLSNICNVLGISLKEFFDTENLSQYTSNDLLQDIYKLTPEQKTTLRNFLKTIVPSDNPAVDDDSMIISVKRKKK